MFIRVPGVSIDGSYLHDLFSYMMPSILASWLTSAALVSANWTDRHGSNSIVQELGAELSPDASIILQDDAAFRDLNKRWQAYATPQFSAVVDVRSEEDVQKTVRFVLPDPGRKVSKTHS